MLYLAHWKNWERTLPSPTLFFPELNHADLFQWVLLRFFVPVSPYLSCITLQRTWQDPFDSIIHSPSSPKLVWKSVRVVINYGLK